MMQLFFLTMVALVLEALVLLSDYYGWKYIILLKTKNYLLGKKKRIALMALIYLLLILANLFFPVSPAPVILGEFVVVLALALFVLFLSGILFSSKEVEHVDEEEAKASAKDFLMMGHSAIEYHKRNLGFAVLIIAAVHLVFPSGILI